MSAAPNRPNGRARWINLGSFAALFALWLLITVPIVGDQPLVAPLFLPSPMSVWNTFLQLMQNGYQGKTLAHHLGISLFRFGVAFGLTVLVLSLIHI